MLGKIIGFAVVVVAAAIGLPYVAGILGYPPASATRVLESLLSWPVIALLLGIFLMVRFSQPLSDLIRYGRMRLPGGVEFQGRLPSDAEDKEDNGPGAPTVSPEQQQALVRYLSTLESERDMAQAEAGQLRQALQTAYFHGTAWEFRYAACFFVPHTKQVLHWFSLGPPQSRASFHAVWTISIPDQRERDTVLEVLLQSLMLEDQAGLLGVTTKGIAFLQFIGMVPYRPRN